MDNLTRRQLAVFFGELNGDLDFPCHVTVGDQMRSIHAQYRGLRLQRVDYRDDRDGSWSAHNVIATAPELEGLPRDLFPEDSLPVYTLLDTVAVIREVDQVIDWLIDERSELLREDAINRLANGLEIPRDIIRAPGEL